LEAIGKNLAETGVYDMDGFHFIDADRLSKDGDLAPVMPIAAGEFDGYFGGSGWPETLVKAVMAESLGLITARNSRLMTFKRKARSARTFFAIVHSSRLVKPRPWRTEDLWSRKR